MRTNLAGSVVVLVGDCELLSFVNLSCICMALYGFKLYHIFIQFLATYLTKLRKSKQDLQTQWKKYHVILEAVAYGQGMIFLERCLLSVVSGAKHVYHCVDLDLWNNKHISYKLIQYAFQKLLSYTYGQNCQKKTSLATPFRLLVSPTIFSVSMHYHYIYVLQISDLLLPHRTCFANPVTVRLLNKDRFTGLKFSMCLNKNIDVI